MTQPLQILVDVLPHESYTRGVVAGIARFCREHSHVKLRFRAPGWDMVRDYSKLDGVITGIRDVATLQQFARTAEPVVNISAVLKDERVPRVIPDNRAIGRMVAEHLLNHGYPSFSFQTNSTMFFAHERLAGFRQRLKEADCTCSVFDSALVKDQSANGISAAALDWVVKLPKPVGVFSLNDLRALMLLELCRDAGISVPEEVGLVGVDDDDLLDFLPSPTLTSVDPSADVVGYQATQLLVDVIEGRRTFGKTKLIPPRQVVQRQSTQAMVLEDEALSNAISFIREHALESIGVDDVARAVLLSRRVLERRFRSRLGRAPAEEIRRVQLERAKVLLLNSRNDLKQIAAAVGYREYRNFATAFRRDVGMSPNTYRRQFQRM